MKAGHSLFVFVFAALFVSILGRAAPLPGGLFSKSSAEVVEEGERAAMGVKDKLPAWRKSKGRKSISEGVDVLQTTDRVMVSTLVQQDHDSLLTRFDSAQEQARLAEQARRKQIARAQQVELESKYARLVEQHAELGRVVESRNSVGRLTPGRSSLERGRWSITEQPRGSTPERAVLSPSPRGPRRKTRPDSPYPWPKAEQMALAEATMAERLRIANRKAGGR